MQRGAKLRPALNGVFIFDVQENIIVALVFFAAAT
jgi:hypothetical protein